MLRLVVPKGSLEKATFALFESADLAIIRHSSVDYKASVDDPRIDEVRILRPQEIPIYVAEGLFDVGITGRDWVNETGADVVSLGELGYSKATSLPIRVIVAVAGDSSVERIEDLKPGVRVATEYPEMTRRYFAEKGIDADIRLSYGATEAKIPDIADVVVDLTESGRALKAAGVAHYRHHPYEPHRGHRQYGVVCRSGQASRHGTDHDPAQWHPRSPR